MRAHGSDDVVSKHWLHVLVLDGGYTKHTKCTSSPILLVIYSILHCTRGSARAFACSSSRVCLSGGLHWPSLLVRRLPRVDRDANLVLQERSVTVSAPSVNCVAESPTPTPTPTPSIYTLVQSESAGLTHANVYLYVIIRLCIYECCSTNNRNLCIILKYRILSKGLVLFLTIRVFPHFT